MDDVTNLVGVAALGIGYLVTEGIHYLRFRGSALEWEERLMGSTLIGAALFVGARILVSAAVRTGSPVIDNARETVKEWLPFAFTGSIVTSTVLGALLVLLTNAVLPLNKAATLANERYGDALRQLLAESARSAIAIVITINDDLVYIGLVTRTPGFRKEDKFFALLPYVRGFREPGSSKIQLDTSFANQLEHLMSNKSDNVANPEILLPLEAVTLASRFHEHIFDMPELGHGSG